MMISLHENLDGRTFAHRGELAGDIEAYDLWLDAVDMDGDGDLDIMPKTGDGTVWFENDGAGRFSQPMAFASSTWGKFVDLDDDDDADVLANLPWHKNIDGRGTFSAARIIDWDYSCCFITHPADIDGGGDLDIVMAPYYADPSWYENAAFGPQHLIELEHQFYSDLYTSDLDGDGDFDNSDLVLAFQAGHYEMEVESSPADVAAAVDGLFARDNVAQRGQAVVA